MKYDFDEIIDRRNTAALNTDGFREYIFRAEPDKAFPFGDDEFIRMWVADMEFAAAPEILDAMRARVDRKIFGYTMPAKSGYYNALSGWCRRRYGWTFPEEQLCFSPGVVPAIYQLVEDLVGKDESYVIATPSYGPFGFAAKYAGVGLLESPLKVSGGSAEPDFDDLEKKCADPRAKLLIWCNPHNPTGRVWTEAELRRVADIAAKNDLWLISDEIHCDLLRTGVTHTPLAKAAPEYEKLITCMSASKTFNLAGLMLSAVIIRDETERRRFRRRDKLSGEVNPISLEAHIAAYERGEEWLDQLREYLDGNFRLLDSFLAESIPGARFSIPDATYLAWIDMRGCLPDVEDIPLFIAEKAGVLLEGGNSNFVGNAEGYVRMNLAMPRALVKEGLGRIAGAIGRRG